VQNVSSTVHVDCGKSSSNLADEVQLLTRLSDPSDPEEDFVRSVCIQLHRSPMIVLYTREQIDDLQLLCSQESPVALCSVLSTPGYILGPLLFAMYCSPVADVITSHGAQCH